MSARTFSLSDRMIGEIDKAINVLCSSPLPPGPFRVVGGALVPGEADRRESARLMRVNHAGEVAAQALYRGQALTARSDSTADAMKQAAGEELDHSPGARSESRS